MVERGPGFEQNFEAPQTSGEEPYIIPVEQPTVGQELPASSVAQTTPQPLAPEALRSYNIDAVASGSETPDTLDLQLLMNSQFEQAKDNEQQPDAA